MLEASVGCTGENIVGCTESTMIRIHNFVRTLAANLLQKLAKPLELSGVNELQYGLREMDEAMNRVVDDFGAARTFSIESTVHLYLASKKISYFSLCGEKVQVGRVHDFLRSFRTPAMVELSRGDVGGSDDARPATNQQLLLLLLELDAAIHRGFIVQIQP